MKANKTFRVIAIILALIMSATCVSCSMSSEEGETTLGVSGGETETISETEFVPDIEVKDYQSEFIVVNGGSFQKEFHFVENYSGDMMNDAVYERMVNVKEHVGVDCAFVNAGSWTEYAGTVMRTVQSGDDAYQLVMTHTYQGITQLMTGNSLYDFCEFESVNLDAPYWADDLMVQLNVNGKQIFGYNDFCLSNVNVITFNKSLCIEYGITYPYDLVRNKQWTLDKMMEIASQVSVDDGNGKWGPEDTYGLTNVQWATMISLTTACDIKIVNSDETGAWYVAYEDNGTKLAALLEKVAAMYEADWSRLVTNTSTSNDVVPMSTGRTLFYMEGMSGLQSLKGEDINFGILPYPMFDTNQENYKTLSWNGLLCVPTTIQNPEMVGDVLELLAYHSQPVKEAFYENLFGSKVAQDPDDAEMLNILWNTQVSDRAFVVANTSTSMDQLLYMLPLLGQTGETSYSSFLKKHMRSAERGIETLFRSMDKN